MTTKLIKLLVLLPLVICSLNTYASHVPGGNVTYECVGPNQYLVTLTLFEDCGSAFLTNSNQTIQMSNDCNLTNPTVSLPNTIFQEDVSQLCPTATSECDGGTLPGIYMHQWQGIVTLPGPCDTWTFGYSSCCRNTTTNLSGQPGYYWEATMNSQTEPCNTSPVISNPAVPYVCVGQAVCFNLGVVEPDGHTLAYSLVDALSGAGTPVTYNAGYSGAAPISGVNIDPITGQIDFTPTAAGNYVFAVLIEEFNAAGDLVGTIIHDVQFEVVNCANQILDCNSSGAMANITGSVFQTGPNTIQMCEGNTFNFDLQFDDLDNTDSLEIITNLNAVLPGATITQVHPNAPTDYSVVNLNIGWTPPPGSANWNTIFSITVNDNACPVSGQQTFVYNIDVVGRTYTNPDTTICQGQSVPLEAFNGGTFNWNVLSGDPINIGTNFSCTPCFDPTATPSTTTTYEVISDLSGNCVNRDTVTITVVPDFTYNLTQTSANTCLYDPVAINTTVTPGGAGYSYDWTPNNFLDNNAIANPTATITSPGAYTYYLDITSPNGCVKQDSIQLVIASAVSPVIDILASDTTACGGPVSLDVWFDTTVTSAGITDNFDAGPDALMWSNIENGLSATTGCGTMTGTGDALTFDSNGGERRAETVAFNSAPCTTIDFCLIIGNNITVSAPCENADVNESVELQYSIDGGATWILIQLYDQADWDTGGPYAGVWQCFSVPIPAAAQTGNTMFRWVQPSFSACTGCDNWSLDDVSVNCASISSYDYAWTPNSNITSSTIQNPDVEPITPTMYYVTVTDSANGCTAQDSIHIGACPPCPMPAITVAPISCNGVLDGSITATPTGVDGPPWNFIWTDVTTGVTLQTNPTATGADILTGLGPGTYNIEIIDTNACTRDTTITLTEPPAIVLTLSDTTICQNGTATLSATALGGNGGPFVYNWTGVGTGSPTVNPIANACYELIVDDVNGCSSASDSICVTLHDTLTLTLNATAPGTCPGGNVDLSSAASGGNGGPYTFNWTENGTFTGSGPNITVAPNDTSSYCLTIQDGCETSPSTVCIDVNVYPIPAFNFTVDDDNGCYPHSVNFINYTDTSYLASSDWNFGDGTTGNGHAPNHTYNVEGLYDVNYSIVTNEGCTKDTTITGMITAHGYPTAAFTFGPQPTNFFDANITFTDGSTNAVLFDWEFGTNGNLGNSNLQNPYFEFPNNEPGNYDVELVVTNAHGCQDSTTGIVVIDGIFTCYAANAITPNGDQINDVFQVYGEGIDITNFDLKIFDRWGQIVFETTDMNQTWDGNVNGHKSETEIYVWKIKTKTLYGGEKKEFVGHVTVIR